MCVCAYSFVFILLFVVVLQDIDYDGFRQFLDAFLDCDTPEDLAKHLFVSFLKPNVTQPQLHGKALNQMAAISSTAACAPVTAHTKGTYPCIFVIFFCFFVNILLCCRLNTEYQ